MNECVSVYEHEQTDRTPLATFSQKKNNELYEFIWPHGG